MILRIIVILRIYYSYVSTTTIIIFQPNQGSFEPSSEIRLSLCLDFWFRCKSFYVSDKYKSSVCFGLLYIFTIHILLLTKTNSWFQSPPCTLTSSTLFWLRSSRTKSNRCTVCFRGTEIWETWRSTFEYFSDNP